MRVTAIPCMLLPPHNAERPASSAPLLFARPTLCLYVAARVRLGKNTSDSPAT
jgi:hypothetical protein